jgi:hypothetical protein
MRASLSISFGQIACGENVGRLEYFVAIRRSNGVTTMNEIAIFVLGFFAAIGFCGGACITDGAHEGAFQTKAAIPREMS